MSNLELAKKNLKLSSEFNNYVADHPETMKGVPSSACIVFASKYNKELSKKNLKIAKSMEKKCYVAEKGKGRWIVEPVK